MGLNPRFLPEDPEEMDSLDFEEDSRHGVRKFKDAESHRPQKKQARHRPRHREQRSEDD
jgi:hypothetical protein